MATLGGHSELSTNATIQNLTSTDLSSNIRLHHTLIVNVKMFQAKNPQWEMENEIEDWITDLGVATIHDIKLVPYGQWFFLILIWAAS